MGFTVYYRSTEPLDPNRAHQIRDAADRLNEGRTWISCEPLCLFPGHSNGHLMGGSKPNFQPHPEDIAAAESEGLPDGTVNDIITALCELSKSQRVDWEFSHDHDPGPIGFIRNGVADQSLITQINAFATLAGELSGLMDDLEGPPDAMPSQEDANVVTEDDADDPPATIKMWKP